MARRIDIREHAIDRYIKRHRPDLAADNADDRRAVRELLRAAMETAGRIKERTFAGDAIWRSADLDVLLVAKDDPDVGLVVVTVLPADAYVRSAGGRRIQMTEEEEELIAEAASRGPSLLDQLEAREAGVSLEQWQALKAGRAA